MSETQTVTIADFLLARIAEEEREARDAASRHQVEQGRGVFVCTEEGAHVGYSTEHVLAECEAKRRIVERLRVVGDGVHDDSPGMQEQVNGWPVLRLLALPFADHPDYRPEWKP